MKGGVQIEIIRFRSLQHCRLDVWRIFQSESGGGELQMFAASGKARGDPSCTGAVFVYHRWALDISIIVADLVYVSAF